MTSSTLTDPPLPPAETDSVGMLILNADDLGRDAEATDATLECHRRGRLSSASAMVFMRDSERAAHLAREAGLDVGLHLNLTEPLSANGVDPALIASHSRIRRFLRLGKYALLLYHPFLRGDLRRVFDAQWREFHRLYPAGPSHVDGHQHMHLCTNLLLDPLIPRGQRVRRSFSFERGEKSWMNRAYRRAVDRALARRYRLADYFFALVHHLDLERFARLVDLAVHARVEIMTHAWNPAERAVLLSPAFGRTIAAAPLRRYSQL